MKDEIKKGLLDVTPDLERSKSRVRNAVLQPPKKRQLIPRSILGSFVLLSIILVSIQWQRNDGIQGFSQETFNMYGLLDDADSSEEYHKDLIIEKYGEIKDVEITKQEMKNKIASYTSTLPASFDDVLKRNNIPKNAYREQFLTLKAKTQMVYESLLPHYEQMYPQFPKEVHSQLLLWDAVKAVGAQDITFGSTINIPALVLYEGENARVLVLIDEKRLVEEQIIIMPIRDELKLKTGEEVLLENSFIISRASNKGFKQFAVSQNIKVITKNKAMTIPAMQKNVNTFLKNRNWEEISQTREPNAHLKTISGLYSIWYGDDTVIGSGDKGFIITNEMLQNWGEKMIQE